MHEQVPNEDWTERHIEILVEESSPIGHCKKREKCPWVRTIFNLINRIIELEKSLK
jgi:hypothetical protein